MLGSKLKITIELNAVMLHRLQECPVTVLLRDNTLLRSSPTHQKEDKPKRDTHKRCDNRKSTISPPPSRIIQKSLPKLWPGECVDNVWCRRKRKPDRAISQLRSVRDEDVENVVHTIHTTPVEHLSRSVCLHILADAHHNECEQHANQADKEAVRAADEVNEFGEGELGDTTDEVGDNAGDTCEAVEGKFRSYVWGP